jgi:alpha-glucosidase
MFDRYNIDWWRGAVIYQIYPRSFRDSDGNGVGDLAGIVSKLDYIASLGVDAVWISPFFKSPMEDFGYDVEDYRTIDPLFGSLQDFKDLLAGAHARGIRILIDLVISHTSDRHRWFVESRQDKSNLHADWYVWANPLDTGAPPNNWLSVFGGSAWEWDARRCQYYLHNFLKSQPDLNFHNLAVRDAVLDEAQIWLDLGVDGFRLDVVNYYFHDKELRNNPSLQAGVVTHTVSRSNPYSYQDHIYDKTRPETLAFLERFRALLNSYPGTTAVGELGVDTDVVRTSAAYTERGKRLQMVYSFDLMCPKISAAYIRSTVSAMDAALESGWVSWALTNHDFPRVVSRWGFGEYADIAAPMLIALVCSLRGSPCIFQGEELGLPEADVPFERLQDPYGKTFWPRYKGRDGCRTPIPWEGDAPYAAFSNVEPWLPIPHEHLRRAVDHQECRSDSPLRRVRKFLAWRRKQPVLTGGSIRFIDAPEPLLAFVREIKGRRLLALFNLGIARQQFDLNQAFELEPALEHGFETQLRDGGVVLPAFGVAFLALTENEVI